MKYFRLSMKRLISALRRSLNGGTKERMSNSADSNQMEGEGDAIGSMKSNDHSDADSQDGFYEVLHNLFPSSPHNIYCSNSQENLPFQSPMADLSEHSSSHENLEFFSGTEECEDPGDTSLQKASSSQKIQSRSMKSVAVQCEPITYVSKGVQWEPLLMVSQSVQCTPLTQVVKEVQCSNTYKSQCEESESVSLVTIGVQYEYICTEKKTDEKQLDTSKQLPENVPLEKSDGVDCESDIHSTSQQCGSEDQQVFSNLADLSITLPSLQEELDVVNSSTSSLFIDSSQGSNVSFSGDEHEVELNSSQPVPSTSSVKCKRKRNCANRVRQMKHSKNTRVRSSSSEGTHEKHSKKRPSLEARTDRSQSENECVNSDDSNKIESKSIQEKEAKIVKKVLFSSSKESTSDQWGDEKLVVEESPEKLLTQMGNNENCLAKEDIIKKKNGALDILVKDKQLQTASQKVINSSCPQSNVTRDVATASESQRTGRFNWFSSLACERYSSPESIGEDMFKELKEDRPNCNKNPAPKVQSKFTKKLSDRFSFRRRESCNIRKSTVQNSEDDSSKPPEKRKKLKFDANISNISASSKNSAQLVPYSDSDSGSETCVDHFRESDKVASSKILKKQLHSKTTSLQKTGIISSGPRKQKTHKVINCDRESKSQYQISQSSSESDLERNRPAPVVVSTPRKDSNESENSGESDTESRIRIKRVQRRKNIFLSGESKESENSGESDSVSRKKIQRTQRYKLTAQQNSRNSRKSSPVHISIWSSDEDAKSVASTVTYRSTVSKSPHRRGAPYVKEEREAIVWYIIDHKFYKLVKGRAMWERMEKEQVCNDRTWQSMKEHFIKKILPQIETFNLSPEITKKFVHVRK